RGARRTSGTVRPGLDRHPCPSRAPPWGGSVRSRPPLTEPRALLPVRLAIHALTQPADVVRLDVPAQRDLVFGRGASAALRALVRRLEGDRLEAFRRLRRVDGGGQHLE